MFSTRHVLAVTALCAATLLTGCSSDDGGDEPTSGDTPSARVVTQAKSGSTTREETR